jgi:hypothetical protein
MSSTGTPAKQPRLATKQIRSFTWYSVFHQFRQAKFANGGSILGSSQFLLLPQLPQKNEACVKSGQN